MIKTFVSRTKPNEMKLEYGDWSPPQMFYLSYPDP